MIPSIKMSPTRGRQSHPEGDKITVGPDERARLKTRRIELALTQRQLAAKARVTQGTISNLEGGGTSQIYLEFYQRILVALKMEGQAIEANQYYRTIVEGAAVLTESEQRSVAIFIESLRKSRQKQ